MKKRIGLTYDLKTDWQTSGVEPVDASAEWDPIETIHALKGAFEGRGHEVLLIGGARQLAQSLGAGTLNVDMVFSISEGQRGRNRESLVPALLELYGIPFSGSDALTLGMSLDKVVAKQIFIANGIPTPRYFIARHPDDCNANSLPFPLFVKTSHEGTSKGITASSRVENYRQLVDQVKVINESYHQPALVEEFIKGLEFTVAVVGNESPRALPIIQYSLRGNTNLGDSYYTFQHVSESLMDHECVHDQDIGKDLAHTLRLLAVKAYVAIGCRDFGRVDFRVDDNGQVFVLEINPLPDLSRKPKGAFLLCANALGVAYDDVINGILDAALLRHNIS